MSSVNLTVSGIDTISTIRINKEIIGHTDNMFRYYTFNVLPYLFTGDDANLLEIEIMSPVVYAKQLSEKVLEEFEISYPPACPNEEIHGECHANMIRKMQSSFGSNTTLAAPSMGIW